MAPMEIQGRPLPMHGFAQLAILCYVRKIANLVKLLQVHLPYYGIDEKLTEARLIAADGGQGTQTLSGLLGCKVALWACQHLVTYHKFFYGGRA